MINFHPRSIQAILNSARDYSISKLALSKASGVSYSTIWRLERGKNPANIKTLQRLETALADLIDKNDSYMADVMDGDAASALASVGWGTDEDYGGGMDRL